MVWSGKSQSSGKTEPVGEGRVLDTVDCGTSPPIEYTDVFDKERSANGGGTGIDSLRSRDRFFSSSSVNKVRLDRRSSSLASRKAATHSCFASGVAVRTVESVNLRSGHGKTWGCEFLTSDQTETADRTSYFEDLASSRRDCQIFHV